MTPTACSFTRFGSCEQPHQYNVLKKAPATESENAGPNKGLPQLLIINAVDSALSEQSTQFRTLHSSPVVRCSSCNNKVADSQSLAGPTILDLQSTVEFLKTKLQQVESQVKMLHDQNHQLRLLFENHLTLEPKSEGNEESEISSPEDTTKILAHLQRSKRNALAGNKEATPNTKTLEHIFALDDAVHIIKNKQQDQVKQLLKQQTEMQKVMKQLEFQNKVQAETIASLKENFTKCANPHEQDHKQTQPQQKEQARLKQRQRPQLTTKAQESHDSSRRDKADSRLDKVASSASTILLSHVASTGNKTSQQALDKRQQKKQRSEEKPLGQQPKHKQPQRKQEQLQQNPLSDTEFLGPSPKDILFSLRTMAVERLNSLNMQQQQPSFNENETNFIVKEISSRKKLFHDNYLAYTGNKKGRTIDTSGKKLSVSTIITKEIHLESRVGSLPEFQSNRIVL